MYYLCPISMAHSNLAYTLHVYSKFTYLEHITLHTCLPIRHDSLLINTNILKYYYTYSLLY